MRLKSRLADWQEHSLLSAAQAEDIRVFEKDRLRRLFHAGLKYAGLFAILLGASLIVAANWDLFSVHARLTGHVLLNALVAALIWRWRDNPAKAHFREGAVYLLSGLTLTLLALIGQSFQLQGDIGGLLLLWMILITGMVVMAGWHERIARLWLAGFTVTLFYGIANIYEGWPPQYATFFCLTLAALLPLAFWCDGHIRILRDLNPPFADMLVHGGLIGAIATGFAASFVFNEGAAKIVAFTGLETATFYLYLAGLAGVTLAGFVTAWLVFRRNAEIIVPALCAGFVFLPFIIPVAGTVPATAAFVALAILLGIAAYQGGHERLLNFCILAVSARFFILFIEVFGTMLMTGWGLIIAGVLLIGLIRLMRMAHGHITARREARHA